MKRNVKLKQIKLTRQEWNDALKVPLPYRDKSKYYRKEKHKNSGNNYGSHSYFHMYKHETRMLHM